MTGTLYCTVEVVCFKGGGVFRRLFTFALFIRDAQLFEMLRAVYSRSHKLC